MDLQRVNRRTRRRGRIVARQRSRSAMKRIVAIVLLNVAVAAQAEWQLPDGYRIEEYAREPRVIDPIAMDWDGDGRLHILESSGRIKVVAGSEPKVLAEGLAGATGLAL